MSNQKKGEKNMRSVSEVEKEYLPKSYGKEQSEETLNPGERANRLAKKSLRALQQQVFH